MDAEDVFHYSDLTENMFMQQSDSFIDKTSLDQVCKLQMALYGIKQAPMHWLEKSVTSFGDDFKFIAAHMTLAFM